MQLRPYQQDMCNKAFRAWSEGHKNNLIVLPTGGGKTVVMAEIIKNYQGNICLIAHRQELIGQASNTLARNGIPHRLMVPQNQVRGIVDWHMRDHGRSYYDPKSKVAVAGVKALAAGAKKPKMRDWMQSIDLWIVDEAHHVIRGNEWGRVVDMMPNAMGLGVTATPTRSDGKGLGRHADGVFDVMFGDGPTGRDLINEGYLTDYVIYTPESCLDLDNVRISAATGDYNENDLADVVANSQIVGDVVDHYCKLAYGKLGVTFCASLEQCDQVAAGYEARGIRAAVLSYKIKDAERVRIMNDFRAGKIQQLVNKDMLGEGVDVPAIEVVSMARPTMSFGLYSQSFGRALRLMPGKELAIIIDHVGNIKHGLPDRKIQWTLDRRKKSNNVTEGVIPLTTCLECMGAYERFKRACPYCGASKPAPSERKSPEQVDGNLIMLDQETMAKMRGEVAKVDMSLEDAITDYRRKLQAKHCPKAYELANVKRFALIHGDRLQAQEALREAMAVWGGYRRWEGLGDDEIFSLFYLAHGVDWLTAMTLNADKANKLTEKLNKDGNCNIRSMANL